MLRFPTKSPPALERSFKNSTKHRRELLTDIEMESIPLLELLSLVKDIYNKTPEASRNSDLDILEFLGIDKASQTILGELVNNTSKLTDINERIKKLQKVKRS